MPNVATKTKKNSAPKQTSNTKTDATTHDMIRHAVDRAAKALSELSVIESIDDDDSPETARARRLILSALSSVLYIERMARPHVVGKAVAA